MLLLSLMLGALLAGSPECSSLISSASGAYGAKNFGVATAVFTQAVKACGPRAPLLLGLAQSQLMMQRFDESVTTLDRLIAIEPGNVAALKLRGDALYLGGKDNDAEAAFHRALEVEPANESVHYALGRMYYQQNRYPEAVTEFQKAIERDPESYRGHDNLALCYEALQQDDLALKHYFKALDLVYKAHPEYDWVYGNLASFFLRRGEDEKAFQLAAEAAKRNPASARNFFLAGKSLFKLNRTEQSLRWLKQAEQLDPDYPDPRYVLAQIYRKQGNTSDAERELNVFRELNQKPRPRK